MIIDPEIHEVVVKRKEPRLSDIHDVKNVKIDSDHWPDEIDFGNGRKMKVPRP